MWGESLMCDVIEGRMDGRRVKGKMDRLEMERFIVIVDLLWQNTLERTLCAR